MKRNRWPDFLGGRGLARRGVRPRVLVTEGGNVGVLAVVRGLDRAGYEPWVAAVGRNAVAAWSRATAGAFVLPDPSVCAEAFARGVAELAEVIEAVAVLPGGEKGMLALANARLSLPSMATLAVCDRQTAGLATDKAALSELATNAGLRTPPTFFITAEHAARRRLPVALPAIVKPPRSELASNGGFRKFNVRLVSTREQVITALGLLPDGHGLLQEYHSGTLTGLGGVFWAGKLAAAVYQRAVRTWPVDAGEMSYAVALPRDSELEQGATRLLAQIGWSGLFQMQFLENDAGRVLIDLNPRVYGSLALGLAAGQNLPGIWVDRLLGKTTTPAPYQAGVSFRNELLDARALLAGARAREIHRPELSAAVAHQATVNAFFQASDPMPLLALLSTLTAKVSSRATTRWNAAHG